MAGSSIPDENVWDKAGVGEVHPGDWGCTVLLQPLLHGMPLVAVPISRNHRLTHHFLQVWQKQPQYMSTIHASVQLVHCISSVSQGYDRVHSSFDANVAKVSLSTDSMTVLILHLHATMQCHNTMRQKLLSCLPCLLGGRISAAGTSDLHCSHLQTH